VIFGLIYISIGFMKLVYASMHSGNNWCLPSDMLKVTNYTFVTALYVFASRLKLSVITLVNMFLEMKKKMFYIINLKYFYVVVTRHRVWIDNCIY
jgi:hypothetical protein